MHFKSHTCVCRRRDVSRRITSRMSRIGLAVFIRIGPQFTDRSDLRSWRQLCGSVRYANDVVVTTLLCLNCNPIHTDVKYPGKHCETLSYFVFSRFDFLAYLKAAIVPLSPSSRTANTRLTSEYNPKSFVFHKLSAILLLYQSLAFDLNRRFMTSFRHACVYSIPINQNCQMSSQKQTPMKRWLCKLCLLPPGGVHSLKRPHRPSVIINVWQYCNCAYENTNKRFGIIIWQWRQKTGHRTR